jgi:hypothetical protein
MGFMKNRMIEEQERGWRSAGDHFVCDVCIDDDALKALVREEATAVECDFCGRKTGEPVAAAVDDLIDEVDRALKTEWTDPIQELFWDSGEGGYQGEVLDTAEVFDEVGWPTERRELQDVIVASFDHHWCERDYGRLRDEEALTYDWREFVETTTRKARYLFLLLEDDAEWEPARPVRRGIKMLEEIGRLVEESGLLRHVPAGEEFVRVRTHDPGNVHNARDLGSPPAGSARASRMSPAGIPMFYGAGDLATALAETVDPADLGNKEIAAGRFALTKTVTLVDLSNLPPVPSIYDANRRDKRSALRFLHGFREDISRRIEKGRREHVAYVPTQVVTEFFRLVFVTNGGVRPQGLVYPSAQHKGGESVVLFIEREDCLGADENADKNRFQLRLTQSSRIKVDLDMEVLKETPLNLSP